MSANDFRIMALSDDFDRSAFDCEVPEMNEYLQRYAKQSDEKNLTRTHIAMDDVTGKIVAYYATALAQVEFEQIPVRGMPKRYPFVVGHLIQLAVDRECQGRGIGKTMLFDALARFEQTNKLSAIPAVVLDLRKPELFEYYQQFGFVRCGGQNSQRMYMLMKTIEKMGLNPVESKQVPIVLAPQRDTQKLLDF